MSVAGSRCRIAMLAFCVVVSLLSISAGVGRVAAREPVSPAGTRDAISLMLVPVAVGLDSPVYVTGAGDGSGRLFVVERPGRVRAVAGGQLLDDPFLDITDLVHTDDSEQGLLGLAFDPHYAQTGRFYVYFTATDGADTLMRFQVSSDPNRAVRDSGSVLFALDDRAPNHNGGMLDFGPDGYLYVGIGDEGGAGDQYGNAQNRSTLFGAILRLDVSGAGPYTIPDDNPFAGQDGLRGEIWAWGLRNPWRFSFDRANGDLYIGDVGQGSWEEIDVQPTGTPGGVNYGWNIYEGSHCFGDDTCNAGELTMPVAEYSHDLGCSVVGGYVYRGALNPLLSGSYLFGDYCSGLIWSLQADAEGEWQMRQLLDTDLQISSFGEDDEGELYVLALNSNTLYRLTANSAFLGTWQRTDLPVASGAVSRTWMWGPQPYAPALTEEYREAPAHDRTVMYYDKARMELTHPDADPTSVWYVTNGLLSKELITGFMQVGDDRFDDIGPATVNVAGDPDDRSAPTYASFTDLLDAPAVADGAPIIARLSRSGDAADDPTLVSRGVTAAYRVTVPGIDHQTASPFWQFMNATALVYEDGALVNAPLFQNAFYATGYPITEAYWARVKVNGISRDVLMQCFERRCLTYTPDNPEGWRVEAGNVGQHYYRWRYGGG